MKPLSAPISRSLAGLLGKAIGPALGSFFERSLPALDGTQKVAALDSPVEVLRDRYGVPQVFADSEHDLFFAQGYVHAQDRFFQMEMQRRAGHGRLAEILGAKGLELDRLARVMGFSRIASASVSVPAGEPRGETLRAIDAYSAGVNACLAAQPRIAELKLLRVRPEPWTPADTAAWSLVMAWSLSASWETELTDRDEDAGETAWSVPGRSGSNAWAVAPSRSATGSALLAGDPHLALGIPCLWYEVGLYGGRYGVVGASLPGTPGVVIGHNEHLAWSVTAALTDVQDLFVERFSKEDPRLYEHDGEWLEAEVREEEIPIRGRRRPAVQRVRGTVNGPVITDAVEYPGGEDVALRWATPEPLELVEAGLAVDRATGEAELLEALRGWQAPNQNFVYADRRGTVGWALAGHAPVRPSHRGDRPVPGWTDEHRWLGFLTFEEMPRESGPDNGTVVSANEPPPGAEDLIPGRYLPEYRKRRIEALLGERHLHDIEGFRDIQADLYCAPAHALTRRLAALEPPPGAVPDHIARDLAGWDGRLTAESRPGALARVTLEVLLREAAGPPSQKESSIPSGVDARLAAMLPRVVAGLDELTDDELRSAMQEAVEVVSYRCGVDPAGWTWGELHEFELRHPFGVAKALRPFFNRGPYPAGGDANTPNLSGFRSGGPGHPGFSPVTTGPNYRFVVDTGDWDRAWSVLSPGQSGNPASPNYDDQVGLWLDVRYRPMVFGRKTAELAAKHRLTLVPD